MAIDIPAPYRTETVSFHVLHHKGWEETVPKQPLVGVRYPGVLQWVTSAPLMAHLSRNTLNSSTLVLAIK